MHISTKKGIVCPYTASTSFYPQTAEIYFHFMSHLYTFKPIFVIGRLWVRTRQSFTTTCITNFVEWKVKKSINFLICWLWFEVLLRWIVYPGSDNSTCCPPFNGHIGCLSTNNRLSLSRNTFLSQIHRIIWYSVKPKSWPWNSQRTRSRSWHH